MILQHLTELTISEVLNRGVPNKECIALQANVRINLGQFGLMLGRYTNPNSALPYFDQLFWFGDGYVQLGDWLFVYTGSGSASKTQAANGVNDVYCLFWGKPTTLFADTSIAPILFRADAVNVPAPPANVPQIVQPPSK